MSTTYADVTYIGGAEDMAQRGQPSWSEKGTYDLDKATVVLVGSAVKADAYMLTLARGAWMQYIDANGSQANAPTMFLDNATKSGDGATVEVTLSFIGTKINADLPPEKKEDSLCSSSVTTTVTITDPTDELYTEDGSGNPTAKVTLVAEYKAARTSYSYYRTTEPDANTPEFTTVTNQANPLDRITRMTATSSNNASAHPGTIALATMIQLVNSLTAVERTEDYRVEAIIPEKLWHCSVTAQYDLVGT